MPQAMEGRILAVAVERTVRITFQIAESVLMWPPASGHGGYIYIEIYIYIYIHIYIYMYDGLRLV